MDAVVDPASVEVDAALEAAGLTNPQVREFVRHWARHRRRPRGGG